MKSFYREINIHKPHTDLRNKQIGGGPYEDRQDAELLNLHSAHNAQIRCIKYCIF